LLADALDEPVFVTIDGERRQITKREAIVHQLVNKSTTADLRATKMLFDMMKEAEQKADAVAPAEKNVFAPTDKEVVRNLVERIRRQVLAEMAEKQRKAGGSSGDGPDETAGSNGDTSDDG